MSHDKQAAMQKIASEIYAPVFFSQLSRHGIATQNPVEQEQLLKLAALTRGQASQHKTASENPFLAGLIAEVEQAHAKTEPSEIQLKTAASQMLADNPDLLAAIQSLEEPEPAAAA